MVDSFLVPAANVTRFADVIIELISQVYTYNFYR